MNKVLWSHPTIWRWVNGWIQSLGWILELDVYGTNYNSIILFVRLFIWIVAMLYTLLHLTFWKSVHQSLEAVRRSRAGSMPVLESSFQRTHLQGVVSSFVKHDVFYIIILSRIWAPWGLHCKQFVCRNCVLSSVKWWLRYHLLSGDTININYWWLIP